MGARTERHLEQLVAAASADGTSILAAVAKGAAPGQKIKLPPEFTWRDYTVFLLTIAAQIEHSLMVQYLYAAHTRSADPQLGPPVTDQQRQQRSGMATE